MLDPSSRWGPYGKPDYAGLLTYAGMPWTEDPAELDGVDVAIVGAPFDDLVSNAPGTRFGPRAIREASAGPGPHIAVGVDPFEALSVVDYGDAPVVPADPVGSHAAIERTVAEVVAAGAIPLVLGGDHSIAEPDMRACAARHGALALLHFDTHTDTGREVFGARHSHGTPMFRLVEDGIVDARRYAQVGLRGYWPGAEELRWAREAGVVALTMAAVRERGIADVLEEALAAVGDGPAYVTVDVDVLDPSVAPGTGTPEPGGMAAADLLWACRVAAERLTVVGMEVVEAMPLGPPALDPTALVADRIARELLTGLALRRSGGGGGGA